MPSTSGSGRRACNPGDIVISPLRACFGEGGALVASRNNGDGGAVGSVRVSLGCQGTSSCCTGATLWWKSLSFSSLSVLVSWRERLTGTSGRDGYSECCGDLWPSDTSSSWGKNIFTEELACPMGLKPADLAKPNRALAGLPVSCSVEVGETAALPCWMLVTMTGGVSGGGICRLA